MEPGAWIKHPVQDAGPWEIASVNVDKSIGVDGDVVEGRGGGHGLGDAADTQIVVGCFQGRVSAEHAQMHGSGDAQVRGDSAGRGGCRPG